ncbi:CLUMA_CG014051, isoform A [Clunio marinus]|uniref:CLUMA_CG014051, isoform A n=1 Tax=Clunio marinus TaxID=568069 RepID=A0A1J1IKN5_9DIPT|nr:CLUMA_CG014051, isoform A [Clunio marinus]
MEKQADNKEKFPAALNLLSHIRKSIKCSMKCFICSITKHTFCKMPGENPQKHFVSFPYSRLT